MENKRFVVARNLEGCSLAKMPILENHTGAIICYPVQLGLDGQITRLENKGRGRMACINTNCIFYKKEKEISMIGLAYYILKIINPKPISDTELLPNTETNAKN